MFWGFSHINIFPGNQQEREEYEYVIIEGKIVHKLTGKFLHTMHGSEGTKWIFVMSTFKKLYAGLVCCLNLKPVYIYIYLSVGYIT